MAFGILFWIGKINEFKTTNTSSIYSAMTVIALVICRFPSRLIISGGMKKINGNKAHLFNTQNPLLFLLYPLTNLFEPHLPRPLMLALWYGQSVVASIGCNLGGLPAASLQETRVLEPVDLDLQGPAALDHFLFAVFAETPE
jgi:hypothetical protein